jgi:hypothetical protein
MVCKYVQQCHSFQVLNLTLGGSSAHMDEKSHPLQSHAVARLLHVYDASLTPLTHTVQVC